VSKLEVMGEEYTEWSDKN